MLQPTGETTIVLDQHNVLHYAPVMQVNPILASGFTIFSLIYSVIAGFFGTKAPTAEELLAKKKYLEETTGILEDIRKLEGKHKETSLIERLKKGALEVKSAVKEVVQSEHQAEIIQSDEEQSTQADETIQSSNNEQSPRDESEVQNSTQSELEAGIKSGGNATQNNQWNGLTSRSMVPIEKAAELLSVSLNTIVTLRNKGALKTAALNKQLIDEPFLSYASGLRYGHAATLPVQRAM